MNCLRCGNSLKISRNKDFFSCRGCEIDFYPKGYSYLSPLAYARKNSSGNYIWCRVPKGLLAVFGWEEI